METLKKHVVFETVPLEECWRVTRKVLVGMKRVDTNTGDKEKTEYRCTSGRTCLRRRRRWGQRRCCFRGSRAAGDVLGFHRRGAGLLPCESQERCEHGSTEGGLPGGDAR